MAQLWAFSDIPKSISDTVPWVLPVPDKYLPYDHCATGVDDGLGHLDTEKIKITKISSRLYSIWHSSAEVGWQHYMENRRTAEIQYQVTCNNRMTYQGVKHIDKHAWDCEEWKPGIHCDDYDETTEISPETFNFNNGKFGDNFDPTGGLIPRLDMRYQLDLQDFIASWKGQRVTYPEYKHVGEPGSLPRPVLLIHGLNSDFKVWGALPKTKAKSSDDFRKALVKGYVRGGLPDILSRSQNLDVTPQKINTNGIYFYQAPGYTTEDGWLDVLPAWILNDSANSQAFALYKRLEEVLTSFYDPQNLDWKSIPDLQIDLVCHSQGGLVVREMLRGLRVNETYFPTGAANAANHIRKIVTVNTPHFGSALAGSTDEIQIYPGLTGFIEDLENTEAGNPSTRTLIEANVNIPAMEKAVSGANSHSEKLYKQCEEDDYPEALCGFYGAAGGVLGFFGGSITDVSLKIKGPYLGPYSLKVYAGSSEIQDEDLDGPAGVRESLLKGRKGGSHLSPSSDFLRDINSPDLNPNESNFPTRPDGSKIETQPMYSQDTRVILSQVLGQVAEGSNRICTEMEYNPECLTSPDACKEMYEQRAGCFAPGTIFKVFGKKLSGYEMTGVDFSGEMLEMLQSIQDHWLSAGDAVVEASSQKMVNENFNLSPRLIGAYFRKPLDYVFHDVMAPWEPVVHGPMNIDSRIEDLDADIKVDHAGTSRQGLDLMCALDLGCAYSVSRGKEVNIFRVSSAEPVQVSRVSSKPLFKSGVDLTGDFQIQPVYTSRGIQGVGLSDGSASYQLLAYYKPEVGTQIWYKDQTGAEKQVALVSADVVTQPQISRVGNSILVKAMNYSGKSWEQKIDLNLSNSVRLDVLVENGADAAPLITGTGTASDPNSQTPPSPPAGLETGADVSVMHAEVRGAGEDNTSRPKIAILNTSENQINGFKLAYYFTADPEHNPKVELDYPQKAVSLEYLGGRNWRFVIDASDVQLAGKSSYPLDQGWQIRLHYADWQFWHHLDDYSSDYSLGIWNWNEKIVVYDLTGKILWGKEPAFAEVISPTDPEVPVQGSVTMTWRDVAPWETNILKPEITIQNTGSVAVENYRARLYFRAPAGKLIQTPVEDWYTPNSTPSLTDLGNGLWQLEFDFSGSVLAPGEKMVQGNVGTHLMDWSTMEKSYLGGAVLDNQGRLIFGTLWNASMVTPIPSTIPEQLSVWIRDESPWDPNYLKPRFKVQHNGQSPVQGFDMHFSIQTERGLEPVMEPWNIPGCEARKVEVGNGTWDVTLSCSSLNIQPGGVWPDDAGAVFGLHFADWSFWDRSNDPSFVGITGNWMPTAAIAFSHLVSP